MPLFDRKVIIQFDNRSYEDLRVDFSVTKTLGGKPNTANISVYNILDTSGLFGVFKDGESARIRLLAGYGDAPGLLFDGFLTKDGASFSKSGGDRVLKLKAKDGFKSYQTARVSLSLASETTYQDALEQVLTQLGLPIDTVDVPPDIRLTQGVSLEGQAADILDRLALSANADWSIQDGKFLFLEKRRRRNGQGPLFSFRKKNILGVPQKKKDGVTVQTLINGPFIPGSLFRLETKDGLLDGDYKIKKVDYKGSSWDGEFTASVFGVDYQTVAEEAAARAAAERAEFNSRFKRVFNPTTGEADEVYRPPDGKGVIPRF